MSDYITTNIKKYLDGVLKRSMSKYLSEGYAPSVVGIATTSHTAELNLYDENDVLIIEKGNVSLACPNPKSVLEVKES